MPSIAITKSRDVAGEALLEQRPVWIVAVPSHLLW
jgi:hypothetical protein